MSKLTSIPNEGQGRPATIAETTAVEFKAVRRIAAMSREKREQNSRAMAYRLAEVPWICSELVSRQTSRPAAPSFEVIEDATQVAKELLEILTATQCGLFACLAEIEGEELDDDPDDRVAA